TAVFSILEATIASSSSSSSSHSASSSAFPGILSSSSTGRTRYLRSNGGVIIINLRRSLRGSHPLKKMADSEPITPGQDQFCWRERERLSSCILMDSKLYTCFEDLAQVLNLETDAKLEIWFGMTE
ncbi:hypothetical protein DY000_02001812, partial [Brassica cretica]